jgi:4-hydroxybenzoate polyprenyltransferase
MPALIQEVAFPQSLLGLYAYGILWTISYDTLYALQDEPWDRRLGIGSLAVLIGVRKAPYLLSGLMVARICLLSLTVTSWTQSAVYAGIQLFVLFHLCQRLTCSRTLHRSFHWWASAEGVMVALCIGLNAM